MTFRAYPFHFSHYGRSLLLLPRSLPSPLLLLLFLLPLLLLLLLLPMRLLPPLLLLLLLMILSFLLLRLVPLLLLLLLSLPLLLWLLPPLLLQLPLVLSPLPPWLIFLIYPWCNHCGSLLSSPPRPFLLPLLSPHRLRARHLFRFRTRHVFLPWHLQSPAKLNAGVDARVQIVQVADGCSKIRSHNFESLMPTYSAAIITAGSSLRPHPLSSLNLLKQSSKLSLSSWTTDSSAFLS